MLTFDAHHGRVEAVAFGGHTLATAGADGRVRLWDGPALRLDLAGHAGPAQALAFSPDGSLLASGGADRAVRVWDVLTGTERLRIDAPPPGVTGVAWLPDAPILTIGTGRRPMPDPGGVFLHDAAAGARRDGHVLRVGVWSLAASPTARVLAWIDGEKALHIWDVTTPQPRHVAGLRAGRGVAFSPDGKSLAAGGDDYTVRVCDVARRQQRSALAGHRSQVVAVAYGPDGRTVASGSWDQTVRVWDAEAGRERAAFAWPVGRVTGVAFSGDGLTAAAGGDKGQVILWDVG